MNFFLNRFLTNIPPTPQIHFGGKGYKSASAPNGLQNDTFEKRGVSSHEVSFTSKKGTGSTKKGDVLKELDNITCPYSGVKMIPNRHMDRIAAKLERCENITEDINTLQVYQNSMQKLEKRVFMCLKEYQQTHPYGTINDCLNELKPECLAKLKVDQLKVLDDVDKTSNRLDAPTALKIRAVTTKARKKILEDRADSIFKRKDLLVEIHDIMRDHPNQELVQVMWNKASKLPRSTKDFNAFVVKYSKRSDEETAARLLKPSVASIEHIRPSSPSEDEIEGGDDNLTNFMLASRDWNTGRSNKPLPEFIAKHPNIPKYSQMYINDIIKAIHKGLLEDCDWYPYVIKEKLYNESQGLIDLKLDRYKISREDALATAPEDVINIYNDLVEKNSLISSS